MEKDIKQLKNIFNLSTYEVKIYLAALSFAEANLTELAQKANIPRTAAYPPIRSLLKQGFISTVKIKKRTYYRATDPDKLEFLLYRKQLDLKETIKNLKQEINIPERKLAINYYNGLNGVEVAADIFLEEARTKKAKSWETTDVNIKEHSLHQLQDYINRRVKKGITGEAIVSANPDDPTLKKIISRDKDELRKSIIINPKKYPFKAAIGVMDDMVLIFSTEKNPFAILIKNKDVAETFWNIHEMYWDRYHN